MLCFQMHLYKWVCRSFRPFVVSIDLVIPKIIENLRQQYANWVRRNPERERIDCTPVVFVPWYLFNLYFEYRSVILKASSAVGKKNMNRKKKTKNVFQDQIPKNNCILLLVNLSILLSFGKKNQKRGGRMLS